MQSTGNIRFGKLLLLFAVVLLLAGCSDPITNGDDTEVKYYIRDYNYASGRMYDLGRTQDNWEGPEYDFEPGDSVTALKIFIYNGAHYWEDSLNVTVAQFWVNPSDTTEFPQESQQTAVIEVTSDRYEYHPTEHWVLFSTTNAGTQLEIGVFMIVDKGDGSTDTVGNISEEPYQLRLIKMKRPNPSMVTWKYMWRNVYYLHSTNFDRNTLDIKVCKGLVGTEGDEGNPDNKNGVRYINIMGLDRYNMAGEPFPDGLVDVNTRIIDPERGLLIFPNRRPFDPDTSYAEVELNDTVPEIYDTNNPQDILQKSMYYMEVRYSPQGFY